MVLHAKPTDLISAVEFEQMPEFHERYELIEGRLVQKPLPKFEHGLISKNITRAWLKFDPDEKLGILLPEVSVRINDDYTPAPDLSFWVAERMPPAEVVIAPYPDLAIEIQSPDQSLKTLTDKAHAYIKAGTRLVWIIQPSKKIAGVLKPNQVQPETVQPTGFLDADEVILGFNIVLADLFTYSLKLPS